MKLVPLNDSDGEEGPPYLVNNHVVTRGYQVRHGHFWAVYSMDNWYKGHARMFESRTQREAVAFAKAQRAGNVIERV